MQDNGIGGPKWQIFDPNCQLKPLLPAYLGRPQSSNDSDGRLQTFSSVIITLIFQSYAASARVGAFFNSPETRQNLLNEPKAVPPRKTDLCKVSLQLDRGRLKEFFVSFTYFIALTADLN